MSTKNLIKEEVNNPIWIFDVNGRSYKICLSLSRENFSATKYSIETETLEFTQEPGYFYFLSVCDKITDDEVYEGYIEGEEYKSIDDAINSFPEDMQIGIRRLIELCSLKDVEYKEKESRGDVYAGIEGIKCYFKEHNDNFLNSITDEVREGVRKYILSLTDRKVIELWNRRFANEKNYLAFEIYDATPKIYKALCSYDAVDKEYSLSELKEFDGKIYRRYNDYDLYVWRDETIGNYPEVRTFSNIDEICLRGELLRFIENHPYMYVDIINEVKEQLKNKESNN